MASYSRAAVLLLALLSISAGACGVFERSERTWLEQIEPDGLDASRGWALRITTLEYGNEIGGFVEFYRVDGLYNTRTNPYVAPGACAYFGPVARRGDAFRIVTDGIDGTPLVADIDTTSRRTLAATLERLGGVSSSAPPLALRFGRYVLVGASRACRAVGGPDAGTVDAVLDAGVDAETDPNDASGEQAD